MYFFFGHFALSLHPRIAIETSTIPLAAMVTVVPVGSDHLSVPFTISKAKLVAGLGPGWTHRRNKLQKEEEEEKSLYLLELVEMFCILLPNTYPSQRFVTFESFVMPCLFVCSFWFVLRFLHSILNTGWSHCCASLWKFSCLVCLFVFICFFFSCFWQRAPLYLSITPLCKF